jgi:hypothetical protein
VLDRTALGQHEPYPTLAAKVGARRGQGSPCREGEHAGPGKSRSTGLEIPGPMGPGPRGPITRQE